MNFKYDEVSKKPAEEILAEVCKIDKNSDAGKLILEYDAAIKSGKTVEELFKMMK